MLKRVVDAPPAAYDGRSQFPKPPRLVHLQATILFSPSIVRLLGDPAFPACYRGRLAVRNRRLDLPQRYRQCDRPLVQEIIQRNVPGRGLDFGRGKTAHEEWRQEYNESRPHRFLGERTPLCTALRIVGLSCWM